MSSEKAANDYTFVDTADRTFRTNGSLTLMDNVQTFIDLSTNSKVDIITTSFKQVNPLVPQLDPTTQLHANVGERAKLVSINTQLGIKITQFFKGTDAESITDQCKTNDGSQLYRNFINRYVNGSKLEQLISTYNKRVSTFSVVTSDEGNIKHYRARIQKIQAEANKLKKFLVDNTHSLESTLLIPTESVVIKGILGNDFGESAGVATKTVPFIPPAAREAALQKTTLRDMFDTLETAIENLDAFESSQNQKGAQVFRTETTGGLKRKFTDPSPKATCVVHGSPDLPAAHARNHTNDKCRSGKGAKQGTPKLHFDIHGLCAHTTADCRGPRAKSGSPMKKVKAFHTEATRGDKIAQLQTGIRDHEIAIAELMQADSDD